MFLGEFYFVLAVLIIALTSWLYRWKNSRCDVADLPPGSMGWPLIGETLQFIAPNTSYDIPPFVKERMQRFGPIFKTSLFGQPAIVSGDADFNYYIFQKEGQLFKVWYPDSFFEILGKQNVGTLYGFMHKYLMKMVRTLFGLESLKKMLPEVELESNSNLKMWSSFTSIDVKEAIEQMICGLTAKKLISQDSKTSNENLRENFRAFIDGIISLPINIPGTAFYKCLQGRKKVMNMLKKMLRERRERPRNIQEDFFDFVLEELQREDTVLTEVIALDLMFALLFASFEITSQAITLATKFLVDHPLALKELVEEHETIIKRRENPESGLTWDEYKSMKFTFQVMNETLRLANIVPVMFRKALEEIKFKEYTIPAGWSVMVCPSAVHLDATRYQDPLEFNPWRWEGVDTRDSSRNFMAYGGGMRLCVGAEFAKVQMAVFLHCMVTKYRVKAIKGGDILRSPGLHFPNGFHVQVSEK